MAEFWAAALGGSVDPGPGGVIAVREMPLTTWWIVPVAEPKTAKNRVHPDLYGGVADLCALGGNEFCVFIDP